MSKEPFSKLKRDMAEELGGVNMKKFVGYGFSLPSNKNSNKSKLPILNKLGFNGRLKPYPTEFYFIQMFVNGALKNNTLQKHDNMPCFSHKLFFNVKIVKKL